MVQRLGLAPSLPPQGDNNAGGDLAGTLMEAVLLARPSAVTFQSQPRDEPHCHHTHNDDTKREKNVVCKSKQNLTQDLCIAFPSCYRTLFVMLDAAK
jgi:hypothetical protein